MGDHVVDLLFRGLFRCINRQHGGNAAIAGDLEHEGTGGRPAEADRDPALEWFDGRILDGFEDQLLKVFPFHAPGMLTGLGEEGKGGVLIQ